MADKDWRSGVLVGSGYAIVVDGKVQITAMERKTLYTIWERVDTGLPLPDRFVKQVCFILPPWEKPE